MLQVWGGRGSEFLQVTLVSQKRMAGPQVVSEVETICFWLGAEQSGGLTRLPGAQNAQRDLALWYFSVFVANHNSFNTTVAYL